MIFESDQAALAVVGSRHPNFYGLEQAKRFSRELASHGLTVVSGFAQGVDQSAHEACLEVSYGRTVAVMGCGLDVAYPKESRPLSERIAERGALLSEYPLGTPPLAENFPRRNRIIAGLSVGVLVVQAHARSGSLITAHQAVEEGREVFAIPGPIDHLVSRGVHALLKEGAHLVEAPSDIMEILFWKLKELKKTSHWASLKSENLSEGVGVASGLSDLSVAQDTLPLESEGVTARQKIPEDMAEGALSTSEESLLECLKERPLTCEEVKNRCPEPYSVVASALTRLELKRKIRKNPDGRFALSIP